MAEEAQPARYPGAAVVGGEEDQPRYPGAAPAEPDYLDKAEAFGKTAAGSVVQTAPVIGGATMGGMIGALGGPAAPVTVPVGIAVGGAAGYFFGEKVRDLMEEYGIAADPEELPPELRPYGYAGEVAGGATPFTAAPLVAGRLGARVPVRTIGTGLRKIVDWPISKTEKWLNGVIEWAGSRPGAYLAAETAATTAASVASGVAETVAPGDDLARMGAEVTAGFLNPQRLVIGAGRMGVDKVRQIWQSLTPAGRETEAAKILQQVVEMGGDDPKTVAALLRVSGIPGVDQTTAQKSGVQSLIDLEQHLMRDRPGFAAETREQAAESLKAIEGLITGLRGTGDPQALAAAADLRAQYFRTLVAARVQAAEAEAVEAARGIAKDSPAARAQLSVRAHELVEGALHDVRKAEADLWGRVPRDIPADTGNLTTRFDTLKAGLLPEERLPEVVEGFMARMSENKGVTTTGELMRFRSRALELAREAAAKNEFNDARIYGNLAEAALDDMDAVFRGLHAGLANPDDYTAARAFSRELHDTFTRTFAGAALRTSATGADRIPPELLLRRALAAGEETGDLRLRQLVDATEFLENRGLGTPEAVENIGLMLDAQERIVRLAAAEAIDPATGRIAVGRASKWLRDNEALLDRFPNIRRDLEAALSSENAAQSIKDMAGQATRKLETQTAFAKLAKVENPVDAVKAALAGKEPVQDIAAFAKIARRGGPDAVEGLRAAMWDNAVRQATSGDAVSFSKLRRAVMAGIRPGQPSVAEIMVREKLMTADEISRLDTLFAAAERIEKTLGRGSPDRIAEIAEAMPVLFDATVRSLGSTAAAKVQQTLTGRTTLIGQSAGSRVAQNVINKMPGSRIQEVLMQAAKRPEFAAALLEKPISPAHAIMLARQIHGYALQAGLTGVEELSEGGPSTNSGQALPASPPPAEADKDAAP